MGLTQGLHRAAQLRPHADATVFGDRRTTWSQLRDRTVRLASVLVSAGLDPGDRVQVIAHNSDRYIELYYAVWWGGGVIVPGNTRWTTADHEQALEDCGAKIVVVDETFSDLADALLLMRPTLTVLELGSASLEDRLRTAPPVADQSGSGADLAALFYTGGTTGRPKGVMLSHENLIQSALCSGVTAGRRGEGQVFLHSPPMFHIGDAGRIIYVTLSAGTHVVIPSFTPEGVVTAIDRHAVTDLLLVPTMLSMVADHAEKHEVRLDSVGMVSYGAAPISETLLRRAMQTFPRAEFCQGYGQTETTGFATMLTPEFHGSAPGATSYLRSVGRALVGFDVSVVDPAGQEVPRGTEGEVMVRSPTVMLGYWGLPDLTQQTLTDGWVRTGDAGHMDEDGFVFLGDRIKDIIVSGGENIYSVEVENAVASHPGVAECAVIGVPDEKWGERVLAIVRLRPGVETTSDEIIQHCRSRIAAYKCPRVVDIRTEAFPMSAAGKILKTRLREQHRTGTDQA